MIVVGAGLAGLTTAYRLKQSGQKVLVLEASDRISGAFHSKSYSSAGESPVLYELGPNTFMSSAEAIMTLVDELGLKHQLVKKSFKDSKRYFYLDGELMEVPTKPLDLIKSPVLSFKAKLRVFLEPWRKFKVSAFKQILEEESVAQFARRKFGKEFADRIVSTFLQGVWAGDIKSLSAKSVLKKLYELERDYDSVLCGLINAAWKKIIAPKQGKKSLEICSFAKGMETLTNELADAIGRKNILLNQNSNIVGNDGSFCHIEITNGEEVQTVKTRSLIIATKAFQAADLLANISQDISSQLQHIDYASVALAVTEVDKHLLENELDGFGYLVNLNSNPGKLSLGTIFASELFPERAIEGKHLFVSFLGGATKPEIRDLGADKIKEIAIQELKEILSMKSLANPKLVDYVFWDRAIPQYNIGFEDKINSINSELLKYKGLFLAGNYLDGLSISNTIEQANKTAAKVQEYLLSKTSSSSAEDL